MSVDRDEVRRIADLAKLDLDDEEADRLAGEMNRILEHAERLRSLDAHAGTAAPGDESRADADASGPGDDPSGAGGAGGGASGAGGGAPGAESETAGAEPGAVDAPSGPDPLLRPPGAFAPEMIEGFFAVPPPPGVVADEADDEDASDPREPSDARGGGEGAG